MKKFSKEALVPENDKWELAIKRGRNKEINPKILRKRFLA